MDEKVIQMELDAGYKLRREYRRGNLGGQLRDFRQNRYDPKQQSTSLKILFRVNGKLQ